MLKPFLGSLEDMSESSVPWFPNTEIAAALVNHVIA